jgi:hypothetical protein
VASSKSSLAASAAALASVLVDYRALDGYETISEDHVLAWIEQFNGSPSEKQAFLDELTNVLRSTYHTREGIRTWLRSLVKNPKLVGGSSEGFWANVNVLQLQPAERSQPEMNMLLTEVLGEELGIELPINNGGDVALYLDDAIFSGNTAVNVLADAYPNDKKPGKLIIAASDISTGGWYSLTTRLQERGFGLPQGFTVKMTENKSNMGSAADVLRLRDYPNDEKSQTYLTQRLNGGPATVLRGLQGNQSKLFSNETARELLERMFWNAGLDCLENCTNLSANVRPLGYCSAGGKNKTGFGSLFATYRNCPNNAPVALWASEPWFPLLRRRTNR